MDPWTRHGTAGPRSLDVRRRRLGSVAVVVALLGAAACAPAGGATTRVSCTDPDLAVLAPEAGSTVQAGPLTVVGAAGTGERRLDWEVRDGTGTVVDSGQTTSLDVPGAGRFSVPLTLQEGSYDVVVEELADPEAGGTCGSTVTPVTVTAAGDQRWTSGASGSGVLDGSFAEWRGAEVETSASWADTGAEIQVELWQLQSDGDYGTWGRDLDLAIGAIDGDAGETWAAAATGAYDARWSQSLQHLAELWAGRPGTLYIRFAHEFNGIWYSWSVTPDQVDDFVTSWRRFRALQEQYLPDARLVFSPNTESRDQFGGDWRDAFPGPEYVDVMAITYFNEWPHIETAEEFRERAFRYDQFGGPSGIETHREFAESVGLPFAVSEWGNTADVGDSPEFVEQMYGFFNAHAGSGPGQLLYEVLFNVPQDDDDAFVYFPGDRNPQSAAVYSTLW